MFGPSSLRCSEPRNLSSVKRTSSTLPKSSSTTTCWSDPSCPPPKVPTFFHAELCIEEARLAAKWELPAIPPPQLHHSTSHNSSSNTSSLSQFSFSSPVPSSPFRAFGRGGSAMMVEEEEEEEEEEYADDDDLDDLDEIPSPPALRRTFT